MSTKFPGLDALRGLLALTVFVGHGAGIFLQPSDQLSWLNTALNNGAHSAVLGFFCLSGFVIALSLDVNRRNGFSAGEYFLARAFRIAPPLLLTILVTWLAAALLSGLGYDRVDTARAARDAFATKPAGQFVALLTLCLKGEITGGGLNGPLWTLAYEIRLYVVAGLIASVLFVKGRALKAIYGLLLVLYLHLVGWSPLKSQLLDGPAIIAPFALGAATYVFRSMARSSWAALLVGFVGVAGALAYVSPMESLPDLTRHRFLLGFDIAMAGVFCLLILAIVRSGALQRWHALGGYSYTLYILHFPLLLVAYFILYNVAPGTVASGWSYLSALASMGIVLGICVSLGRWIEQPRKQREMVGRWLRRQIASPELR